MPRQSPKKHLDCWCADGEEDVTEFGFVSCASPAFVCAFSSYPFFILANGARSLLVINWSCARWKKSGLYLQAYQCMWWENVHLHCKKYLTKKPCVEIPDVHFTFRLKITCLFACPAAHYPLMTYRWHSLVKAHTCLFSKWNPRLFGM